MKEASVVKYYFTKYFFLAFGLMQFTIGAIVLVQQGNNIKGQFASYLFFTLGLVFVSLYMIFSSRLKRVAVSKKKFVVIGRYKNKSYEWDQVKSLKLMPVFNLYCMKIRGKKGKIYFLPTEESESIYGLFSPQPDLIFKKDK